jgi:hypothetical protein
LLVFVEQLIEVVLFASVGEFILLLAVTLLLAVNL